MKRIGIITHYYGSQNYGGLLQAFALCKKIELLGGTAEQIQYIHEDYPREENHFRISPFEIARNYIAYRTDYLFNRDIYKNMALRSETLGSFRELVSHSNNIYNIDTIKETNDSYDIFITGSDQVWNLDWYDEAYFLKFVQPGRKKYSYAASLGTDNLDEQGKRVFRENLKGFLGISVREFDAVGLLDELADIPVMCVADPTLLLTSYEWDMLIPGSQVEEPYVFCYFLGDDFKHRELALSYAKKQKMKIVTLPHLGGRVKQCDKNFDAIKLYDIDPFAFVSLIKHAECMFTDSFHASVFSNLYKKNFFCFPRDVSERMSNRIKSLCRLFQNDEHFCATEKTRNLDYFMSIQYNPALESSSEYKKLLKVSETFLSSIIQGGML